MNAMLDARMVAAIIQLPFVGDRGRIRKDNIPADRTRFTRSKNESIRTVPVNPSAARLFYNALFTGSKRFTDITSTKSSAGAWCVHSIAQK
jgi:hypothetical protein